MPRAIAKLPAAVQKDTLNRNLDIPQSMGRYKARKILILIRRFDRLAVQTPGQVPIDGYLKLLSAFDEAIKEIERERSDKERVAQDRDTGTKTAVGKGNPPSEHSGVSADNPFAGKGADTL